MVRHRCGPINLAKLRSFARVSCPVTIPERPATLRAEDLPDDARDALRVAVASLLSWQGEGVFGDRAIDALRICTAAE